MSSSEKPAHLGPAYAAQFQDAAVVAAYPYRPAVPDAVLSVLTGLVSSPGSARALDLGCGQGELSRPLAQRLAWVDAVDWSRGMVDAGRGLVGGEAKNLRWIVGRAEDAPLNPPYDLAAAAQSLHWMDWGVVLPRLASVLAPAGTLAIVGWDHAPPAWQEPLAALILHASTNREYRPYDLVQELTGRNLFVPMGQWEGHTQPYWQLAADYVESLHARNGLSRDRMAPEAAEEFDQAVHRITQPFQVQGRLELVTEAQVVWGRPRAP